MRSCPSRPRNDTPILDGNVGPWMHDFASLSEEGTTEARYESFGKTLLPAYGCLPFLALLFLQERATARCQAVEPPSARRQRRKNARHDTSDLLAVVAGLTGRRSAGGIRLLVPRRTRAGVGPFPRGRWEDGSQRAVAGDASSGACADVSGDPGAPGCIGRFNSDEITLVRSDFLSRSYRSASARPVSRSPLQAPRPGRSSGANF